MIFFFLRFGLKRVGYLAASVSFNQHTDILIMATNLFRKGCATCLCLKKILSQFDLRCDVFESV